MIIATASRRLVLRLPSVLLVLAALLALTGTAHAASDLSTSAFGPVVTSTGTGSGTLYTTQGATPGTVEAQTYTLTNTGAADSTGGTVIFTATATGSAAARGYDDSYGAPAVTMTGAGTGVSCLAAPDTVLTCTVPAIPMGASLPITIDTTAVSGSGTWDLAATMTNDDAGPVPDPAVASQTLDVAVADDQADQLVLSVNDAAAHIAYSGTTTTIPVTVSAVGPSGNGAVHDVYVTFQHTVNAIYTSATGATCTDGTGTETLCELGTLQGTPGNDATTTIDLTYTVPALPAYDPTTARYARPPITIEPQAGASGTDAVNVSEQDQFDLSLYATDGTVANGLVQQIDAPETASAGQTISYTWQVYDVDQTGPIDGLHLILEPYQVSVNGNDVDTFQNIRVSGGGLSCVPTSDSSLNPGTLDCLVSPVAAGESRTFTVTGDIPASLAGISTDAGLIGLQPSAQTAINVDDSGSDTHVDGIATGGIVTRIGQLVPDPSVSATATGGAPGSDATWTATVSNAGGSEVDNVVVRVPVPAGATFVSASNGCAEANGMVQCYIESLLPADSTTITLVATTPTAGVYSTTFAYLVPGGNYQDDGNTDNDQATASVVVSAVDSDGDAGAADTDPITTSPITPAAPAATTPIVAPVGAAAQPVPLFTVVGVPLLAKTLTASLSGGVVLPLSCNLRCSGVTTLSLTGAQAFKYHLVKKRTKAPLVVATGHTTAAAGTTVQLTVAFTKAAKMALKTLPSLTLIESTTVRSASGTKTVTARLVLQSPFAPTGRA